MGKINYSAVVLDIKSRNKLIERFKDIIPEDWKIIAHHMTINLGEIDPEFEKYLGYKNVGLRVEEIGYDDKVIAVGVTGFPSKNNKPHITLAVNINNGGKPKMSNDLTNWKKIKRPFMVSGDVIEVEHKI